MEKKDSPAALGTQPIGKLLLNYSIPAIIGMTVTSLYNIIDSIFIGHGVGALAISGLAITFPLMNLVIAVCTLVAVGGATILSIYLGEKNESYASMVLGNVLVLCILNGLVFGGIMFFFLDPILIFFGASAGTLPYARDFMQVILLGTPIAFVFIGLNNIMRSSGYPAKAMYSSLLTVVVNIIVAPIFIFVLDWGIRGAALATIIAQATGMVWVLLHFMNKNNFIHFKAGIFKLRKRIISSIFAIGLSPFLMNACACFVVIVMNRSLLTYGGDMAIGAYGIVNRLVMLFVMIVMGLTQGMQPIVGYNYGAKHSTRVKKTLRYGIIAGTIITSVGFIMAEFFTYHVVALFTNDEILIQNAMEGLRVGSLVFPFVGAQIVIANFFLSIGKAWISIFLSLSRQLLFLTPALLILPHYWGIQGVWMSIPVSDFIAFILAIILLIFHYKKMKDQI